MPRCGTGVRKARPSRPAAGRWARPPTPPEVRRHWQGDDAGEGAEPSALGCGAREVGIAGEAVQHHDFGCAGVIEDAQDVVMGVAVVHHKRLADRLCDVDVRPERLLLHRTAIRAGAVEVHARLADPTHVGTSSEIRNRRQAVLQRRPAAGLDQPRRLVGVQRDRGPRWGTTARSRPHAASRRRRNRPGSTHRRRRHLPPTRPRRHRRHPSARHRARGPCGSGCRPPSPAAPRGRRRRSRGSWPTTAHASISTRGNSASPFGHQQSPAVAGPNDRIRASASLSGPSWASAPSRLHNFSVARGITGW